MFNLQDVHHALHVFWFLRLIPPKFLLAKSVWSSNGRFCALLWWPSCLLGGLVESVCHLRYAGDFDEGKTKRLKRVCLPNLCPTAMCCMYDIDKSYTSLYLLQDCEGIIGIACTILSEDSCQAWLH